MVGGRAWVYLSISFEVHQIKGSKITDMDEVAIDSDGICVSERGPGELPAARGDLGMLKPGQASKEKNCQVLGDGPCALLLLRPLCSGSQLGLERLSWRPRCRPASWLPALAAPMAGQGVQLPVYLQLSCVSARGQEERQE